MEMLCTELPKQAKYLQMYKLLGSREITGDDFEELVWHFLTRDTLRSTGLTVPTYFLNGTKAGDINLKFDNYFIVPGHDNIPKPLRKQHVLFRMINDYPRYDFISTDAFIQISISEFTAHNTDSKKIELSFPKQVQKAMKALTGEIHTAAIKKKWYYYHNKERWHPCTNKDNLHHLG